MADGADFSWLEELHSKIWKRKEVEPKLFRRVRVTRDHYTELQNLLKGQHPDRDSPEYDGRVHDVQSAKLDFLRSITPLAPRHPHNNEDRVDDDGDPEATNQDGSDINSFFPSTLRFLDLPSLGLKAKVTNGLPLPLFLRQEYDHISVLIKREPRNGAGSVIVSGQPGTGEVLVSLSYRI